jgi:hypothetical protein
VLQFTVVPRFALAVIVALLTISVSGVSSLVVPEPCTGYESAGSDEGACPPTCVTCGCCAQSAEPALVAAASAPEIPIADLTSLLPRLPRTDPRDILHVPKLHLT